MTIDSAVEGLLRRDRWVVLAMLSAVIVASWAYVLAGAGMGMSAFEMTRMSGMPQPAGGMADMAMAPAAWSPGYAAVMFVMWWVMMVAMMLPGATPMILLYAAVQRRQRAQGNPYVPTSLFAASYLLAWAGFSLAAVALHWLLDRAGLLSTGMTVTSYLIGAAILIAAGLYQLTPLKQACLRHCRMPAQYLAEQWRPGPGGGVAMGLRHGAYCLGCCWFLMLLLFFGGIMNLYWIAGLALYVLIEKLLPVGHWLDYAVGVLLLGAGLWLALAAAM